jgi:hypothetical protein
MQVQTTIEESDKRDSPSDPDSSRGIKAQHDAYDHEPQEGKAAKDSSDLRQADFWIHGFCVGLGTGLILSWFLA